MENNYLSEEEALQFIKEYQNTNSKEEKVKVLRKYLKLSNSHDENFNSSCINDPVACIDMIKVAKAGSDILYSYQKEFSLSPYYSAILNSNNKASNNTDWTEFHFTGLLPKLNIFNSITPNQALANKLAQGISNGKVLLTKKSADLLYQLNTDPELAIKYDPSGIHVVGKMKNETNKFHGRVAYSDFNNWSVFGSVLGRKRDSGSYHIYDDKYDFDIRGNYFNEPSNLKRDIETYFGEPRGGGKPYLIEFNRDKGVIYEENN